MQQQNFMPAFTTEDELKTHQLAGLKWTVRHAYEGSTEYREKLDQAGITPDKIQSLDDLNKLPFTTAEDLRDGYPFPLKAVPFEQIVRVHASSGTTGKRKVLCYTQKDIDDWSDFLPAVIRWPGSPPGSGTNCCRIWRLDCRNGLSARL